MTGKYLIYPYISPAPIYSVTKFESKKGLDFKSNNSEKDPADWETHVWPTEGLS